MRRLTPYLALTLVLALILVFVSCTKPAEKEASGIRIVATGFPQYDWLREITDGCDGVDLILLNKNGTDLHSYQPSIEDIRKIGDSSLFVYVGGESEEWAEDAIKATGKPQISVLALLEELGDLAREEETVEGMEEHEGHEHEHDEEPETDEHVWLSLRNAVVLVKAISERLCTIDSKNAQTYLSNASAYISKLQALDSLYAETVKNSSLDTIIVADRFPFLYLVKDYNINYYAAFTGCSAETEASFNTIIFLSEKAESLGVDSILILEKSDDKLAKTVISNTANKNMRTLVLNSLQSVNETDIRNKLTYLEVMEQNLKVIKEALN